MPMMQHSTTTMSSSSSVAAKRGVISSLQGPRPLPLSLPGTTSSSPSRPAKRPRIVVNDEDDDVRARRTGPVILYEHTPKVIHVRPDEFKALVQRLTGQQQPTGITAGGDDDQEVVLLSSQQEEQDPLVLTIGQQHVPPPLPLVDDHHHASSVLLPSPGGAGGFLLSPSSFLFSPATMQAIQELIS